MKALIAILISLMTINGCTTLVTAPIEVTGAVVSTTLNMAGAAGGAVVNTVTGGSKDDD